MANPDHVKKLLQPLTDWMRWRQKNPDLVLDLSEADLSHENLFGKDLSKANLQGANLYHAVGYSANLSCANLRDANLQSANFGGASLDGADLSKANLSWAYLSATSLHSANLTEADLTRANLTRANLTGADLTWAVLQLADLTEANLSTANLSNAFFHSANLQSACLNNALATGILLWETQRAGWSIKGIVCERALWDKELKKPINYAPCEFERLYSEETTIELLYEGGLSAFELSTFPALLQHLASKHPNTNIRLKTIDQTGGGAKITLSLGDADGPTKARVEADGVEIVRAQLRLREDETLRLQIENTTLKQAHESTIRAILSSIAPQVTFNAPVQTAVLASGNSSATVHQTFSDNTALIQLIEDLLARNTELNSAQSLEIQAAKAELQKPNPDKSLLSRTLGFLKTLPKEAVLKGVGKLGEKAAEADWSSLLHRLGEVIHHLP